MPPARTDRFEEAYPQELRDLESAAIAKRREQNGLKPGDPHPPRIGVALSGGGIRSATFCLGVFQSFARLGLIGRIDFLSTVSGGGYFGSFLGASYSRENANTASVETEIGDNHSWSIDWLRNNGRFLSPNGSGDNWMAAAVAVRNWIALHLVLLTFGFFKLGLATLVRANLWALPTTTHHWQKIERAFWEHPIFGIWWSPLMGLALVPFALVMLPTGAVYWLTQFRLLMRLVRITLGVVNKPLRRWTDHEFASRCELLLTRAFMVGLMLFVGLAVFGITDSLGQTLYWQWSANHFELLKLWATLVAAGTALYPFGSRIFLLVQTLLGSKKLRVTFDVAALIAALVWLLLIIVALSFTAYGFAWGWDVVWDGEQFQPMDHGYGLTVAVTIALGLSWWFSRSFSFVNLSSLQQVYAARLRRAYIGASNPHRREQENYSMTDLVLGDDFCLEDYAPHEKGGPLHLINVTINETVSGKTQIERRDRKGLNMAVGPAGLSIGAESHARWIHDKPKSKLAKLGEALWEDRKRELSPITHKIVAPDAEHTKRRHHTEVRKVEALTLGRWCAISGAAFTTGLGASTHLGLSLLLGLANVRLGYWWDSGVSPHEHPRTTPPTFLELGARVISWLLPVQTCLMSEFFARFHGPWRRHWYLSDGGHFENTACYELIRRRVPFIVCVDCGQDAGYEFADLANLIRKVRTDFGAEIRVLRSREHAMKDDPGLRFPLPTLEEIVHPDLLDVIGSPEDFPALQIEAKDGEEKPEQRLSKKHALLARIQYFDTDTFTWLLILKPSLMGDESVDVVQYQRTHPSFPQETTTDQYFDEAQWESYRKLGEHIAAEVFTPPVNSSTLWSPSSFTPPPVPAGALFPDARL